MDAENYLQVQRKVKALFNIDLTHYKGQQMRRRLKSWLVRSGEPGWSEYFIRLRKDDAELARFRDYLMINVSCFFRDPERWGALRDEVLPGLLRNPAYLRQMAPLKLWSAGCSIGAEAYSLAIMMAEAAHGRPFSLLATDLDRRALEIARAGGPYSLEDVKHLSERQKKLCFRPNSPPFYIQQKFAQSINFIEHDLLSDPFGAKYDLILCRNVVIYFNQEAKERLYLKFHDALRSGGVLFLGGTEIIPHPDRFGFHSTGVSFYRKV